MKNTITTTIVTTITNTVAKSGRFLHTPRRVGLVLAASALMPGAVAAAADNPDLPPDPGPASVQQLRGICDNVDTAGAAALGYTVVVLTALPDVYVGGAADEAIFALEGNDVIDGGDGDDLLCLGRGKDRGRGGRGGDVVFGEQNRDRIQGNPGDDVLDGGPAGDECFGNAGVDVPFNCEAWTQ